MTKEQALAMIDNHRNSLINPVEMLAWTWLRVVLSHIDKEAWNKAMDKSFPVLNR